MLKRKRYPVTANPVRFAVMATDHRAQLDETRIAEILAMDALAQGTATPHDLGRLEFMVRVAQRLGRDGIGPEVLPLCKAVLHMTPPDIALLREVSEYHEAQREAATPAQYIRAISRL